MKDKIKIGITQGDVNGIGYEVIIKALLDNRIIEFCTPIVYGSPKVAAYHRKALNINNFSFNNINKAEEANPKRANIINCIDDNIRVELGKSTQEAGEASLLSLEAAVDDLKNNKIDVLLTAPISKHNMPKDKFPYTGHTEFFENVFENEGTIMLLVSRFMKVGLVTNHVPIRDVADLITEELIIRKLEILNKSLINDFTIRKPRIAVLSLNPHTGDDGFLGNEEKDVIIPAIEKAKEKGIMALGPYPPDGFFGGNNFSKFDAILAMYHDQGLAPFKALSFNEGVNFSAGLPIVRTSPVHGTAFELVGKNEASEESFRQAIYLACDIYKNRNANAELNKNPLKSFSRED